MPCCQSTNDEFVISLWNNACYRFVEWGSSYIVVQNCLSSLLTCYTCRSECHDNDISDYNVYALILPIAISRLVDKRNSS